MTDNEIIKALECCKDSSMPCKDCPYAECDSKRGCVSEMCEDALDLINRQKADIEKLRENNKAIMQTMADVHTEAIKEFAETVKKNHLMLFNNIYSHKDFVDAIDRLVKEMIGEKE